jgi:CHAT domain-containing protein
MRLIIVLLFATNVIVYAQPVVAQVDSLLLTDNPTQALALLESSLKKPVNREVWQLLSTKKAEALAQLQRYHEARELLTEISAQQPEGLILAQVQLVQGMVELYQGNNQAAQKMLIAAEQSLTIKGQGSSLAMSNVLTALGLVYYNSGKAEQAQEQLTMALNLRMQLLPTNHEQLAGAYNNLGLVYSSSDPDKALMYYEKALPVYKKLYGDVHAKVAINNSNTGVIYQHLELFGDAINNLEISLATWEKLSAQPNPRKAFVLFQLGYTHQKMQQNTQAETYYLRALQEYKKSYGNTHPDISNVLNALGNIAKSKNEYTEALQYYHEALQANIPDFTNPSVVAIPTTREFYNGNYLLYSLMYKAQVLEARHLGKTLRFFDLKASLNHLLAADSLIDKLRQQSTNEADKISLGILANEVYADGVRIASHMSGIAPAKRQYYRERAFYFAEKSKSAVLLEAISDANAKSFAGIPPTLLLKEQEIKSTVAFLAQKLSQKPTPQEEKALRESLFTANKQYQLFTRELEQQFPEYYNLKFNTATPSVAALQQKLNATTAMLSYFIDDSKAHEIPVLYIFLITQKKLTITARPLPAEFDKYITGFRNALFYQVDNILHQTGHKLYTLLIPAIPASIQSLVIFPTGRLGVMPFEALVVKPVRENQQPHYFLKAYDIRYEFSASLALQKKVLKQTINSILLCAPVTFQKEDNLSDLPATEKETQSISQLFTSRQGTSRMLVRSDANESAIKANALSDFDVLHFATHGVVDEQQPELSRIFLQSTPTDDGHVYSGEIYNLKLKAALVTLSACQTGLGKISKGEGVIGLSRALAYAGASNILVSFWSVADESTAQLMTRFYENSLSGNSTFAESLQQVKKQMLQHPAYQAPYYWAAFVLIGF